MDFSAFLEKLPGISLDKMYALAIESYHEDKLDDLAGAMWVSILSDFETEYRQRGQPSYCKKVKRETLKKLIDGKHEN